MSLDSYMPRAFKASYNRPLITRDYRAVNAPLSAEIAALRFLESAGYDVSYTTSVDGARRGKELLEHRVFLSIGHDEYVSGKGNECCAIAMFIRNVKHGNTCCG